MILSFDPIKSAKPWLDSTLIRPDWVGNTPRDPKLLWVDKNENFDPILLEQNSQLLRNIDPMTICSYPDSGPVYKKLAKLDEVSPYQLRLTPGSDGGIRVVFDTFVSPGDKVVYTSPTFAMYPVYCKMFGATPIPIAYEPGSEAPVLPWDKLLHAIENHRPKLVCLPNPDSPTGTVVELERICILAETCLRSGSILLLDEAYFPVSRITAKDLIRDFPNIIIARTFAKAWGLAGLRIGYTISSSEIAALLHKVRPMYEVSTFAVAVLDKAIDQYDNVLASAKRLEQTKNEFKERMQNLGFHCPTSHGNFQHVKFGNAGNLVHAALKNKVLYRVGFQDLCLADYSRFSIGPREWMDQIAKLIQNATAVR